MTKSNLKVHSLTGRIDTNLMFKALKNVKRNRGVPGYDKVSIKSFEANLDQNLEALIFDLKHRGLYKAEPLLRVDIPKEKGKTRSLGIPTVRDRVAQEVIRSLLCPIFDKQVSDFSFGFRPGRNAHQAVEQILDFHKQGFSHVVDADIKGFFDNIPHELIIDLVAKVIADGNILGIIRSFLTADIEINGKLFKSIKGTPQGGVISPLLANIVLDVLDKRLAQTDFQFVRYADDFVVFAKSQASAEQALAFVTQEIKSLGLTLAHNKTDVTNFKKGFNFLGFCISSYGVSVRDKSVEKFKNKISSISKRSHNFSAEAISKISRVTRGFSNYFDKPFTTVEYQFRKLNEWIRMRLRCMKFKRISRNDNQKLRNKHLTKLGLVSL